MVNKMNSKANISITILTAIIVTGLCIIFGAVKKGFLFDDESAIRIHLTKEESVKGENPGRNSILNLTDLPDGAYVIELIEPVKNRVKPSPRKINTNQNRKVQLSYSENLGDALLFVSDEREKTRFYKLQKQGAGKYTAIDIEEEAGQFHFNPQKEELAFTNNGNIWSVKTDGSELIQITNSGMDKNPRWSPDGTYLAFSSTRDGNSDIYMIDKDGKQAVNLTQSPHNDEYPDWAPDGLKIAFNSNREGNDDIYIIYTRDKRVRRLTNNSYSEKNAVWSPNGSEIAFLRTDWKGTKNLYSINFGGRQVTQLSKTIPGVLGEESFPVWNAQNEIEYTNQWSKNRESLAVNEQEVSSFLAFSALLKTFSF